MKLKNTTQLRAQLHDAIEQESIKVLVNSAWNFAYSALWSHCFFSTLEKDKARKAIRCYLLHSPDQEKAYYNFCQRVLLARDYVNKNPARFIPLPAQWLDESNENGFAGTEAWLDQMLEKRTSLPLYRREWKALAEAVLEMATDASEKNFWYWKVYFLERAERNLWELFLGIVANMQFKQ
jgi:hypothetical protein